MLGKRVLVVDGSEETELVLRAALEPAGLGVDRIHSDQIPADDYAPSVIVLHDRSPTALPKGTDWDAVPRVIVGSATIPATSPNGKTLESPLQYRDLMNAISSFINDAA